MKWLATEHPELVGKYRRLYGQGSYASKEYRAWLTGRITYFKAKYGFTGTSGFSHRNARTATGSAAATVDASAPLTGQQPLF